MLEMTCNCFILNILYIFLPENQKGIPDYNAQIGGQALRFYSGLLGDSPTFFGAKEWDIEKCFGAK